VCGLKDSSKNQLLASLIPGVMHPTQKKLALAGLIPGIMLLQVRGFLENQPQGAGRLSLKIPPQKTGRWMSQTTRTGQLLEK
jgi:hypothetical protein